MLFKIKPRNAHAPRSNHYPVRPCPFSTGEGSLDEHCGEKRQHEQNTPLSAVVGHVLNLYIGGRGGGVWTGIGYSSQVDDVAVQDLLIPQVEEDSKRSESAHHVR